MISSVTGTVKTAAVNAATSAPVTTAKVALYPQTTTAGAANALWPSLPSLSAKQRPDVFLHLKGIPGISADGEHRSQIDALSSL